MQHAAGEFQEQLLLLVSSVNMKSTKTIFHERNSWHFVPAALSGQGANTLIRGRTHVSWCCSVTAWWLFLSAVVHLGLVAGPDTLAIYSSEKPQRRKSPPKPLYRCDLNTRFCKKLICSYSTNISSEHMTDGLTNVKPEVVLEQGFKLHHGRKLYPMLVFKRKASRFAPRSTCCIRFCSLCGKTRLSLFETSSGHRLLSFVCFSAATGRRR